jgi:hypothetical protein
LYVLIRVVVAIAEERLVEQLDPDAIAQGHHASQGHIRQFWNKTR